jgi:hypothetical protein
MGVSFLDKVTCYDVMMSLAKPVHEGDEGYG